MRCAEYAVPHCGVESDAILDGVDAVQVAVRMQVDLHDDDGTSALSRWFQHIAQTHGPRAVQSHKFVSQIQTVF
ncbi:hypothetical protein [Neoroseomonas lacus]|uniref:Uncharacterized protein n=1 Tax=Neoroseomonas lacus TaxID=287609 RepID=A0A917KPI2_9PROT|nr:hypothetical protein [Neoroseomonas lacus]GGJ21869.1 hypothetical protein GCM10011320_31370 [Neoroseomonas lacus]